MMCLFSFGFMFSVVRLVGRLSWVFIVLIVLVMVLVLLLVRFMVWVRWVMWCLCLMLLVLVLKWMMVGRKMVFSVLW